MSSITTNAIVLRMTPYSESSQILRLLTEHGMAGLLARGIKRPKSGLGGPCDTLLHVEVRYNVKRGHDPLHTLSHVRHIRRFPELGRSLGAFYAGELIREVLLALPTPEQDASPTLTITLQALAALDDGRSPIAVAARFIASLLALHGLTPELRSCVETGKAMRPDQEALFSYREFGLVTVAPPGERARVETLTPDTLRLLRAVFERERAPGEFRFATWASAFKVCSRLMGLALGRELTLAAPLLAEVARTTPPAGLPK